MSLRGPSRGSIGWATPVGRNISARSWPHVLHRQMHPRPILPSRHTSSRLEAPMKKAPYRLVRAAFLMAVALLAPATVHAQFGLGGIVLDPPNLAPDVLPHARRLQQIASQKQQPHKTA